MHLRLARHIFLVAVEVGHVGGGTSTHAYSFTCTGIAMVHGIPGHRYGPPNSHAHVQKNTYSPGFFVIGNACFVHQLTSLRCFPCFVPLSFFGYALQVLMDHVGGTGGHERQEDMNGSTILLMKAKVLSVGAH